MAEADDDNLVLKLTDASFDTDVLNSDQPVLVDFFAPWCGPCKLLSPLIDELAEKYKGRVRVGKLDTDQSERVAVEYRIETIPTVMLFKGGQVVETMHGVASRGQFIAAIERHLA